MSDPTWEEFLSELRTKERWTIYMEKVRKYKETEEHKEYLKLAKKEFRKAIMRQTAAGIIKFFNNRDLRSKRADEENYKLLIKGLFVDDIENLKKFLESKGYEIYPVDDALIIH